MTRTLALMLVRAAADPGAYTASDLGLTPAAVRSLRRAGHLAPPGLYLLPAGRRVAEEGSELYATIVGGVARPNLLGDVLAALLEDEPLSVAGLAQALGHRGVSGGLKAAVETGADYGWLSLPTGLSLTESGLRALAAWPDAAEAVRAELDFIGRASAEVRLAPLLAEEDALVRRLAEVRRAMAEVGR